MKDNYKGPTVKKPTQLPPPPPSSASCATPGSSDSAVATAKEMLECASSWEPDARLLGNIRAADMTYSLQWLIAAVSRHKSNSGDKS